MNILETITAYKKNEVAIAKEQISELDLKKSSLYSRTCLKLSESLLSENSSGIIAEFKRKSPSKGFINEFADASVITKGYTDAGAAGLSVLTDNHFFGGSNEDVALARPNNIPILRKEFIVDEYQITEAKAMGADVILLIAACLTKEEVKRFAAYAGEIGLEVLLELYDETELDHICDETIMIGINNRNLKDFKVDINSSLKMSTCLHQNKIKIAESGIDNVEIIKTFREAGYKGFLIGESFMKTADPAKALKEFIKN